MGVLCLLLLKLNQLSKQMRLVSVFYNGNEISVHNNMWNGVESVRYNGAEMVSKFSWLGATHTFTVEEEGQLVDYEVEIAFTLNGIQTNIWRNEEPLLIGINRGKTSFSL